MSVRNLEYLFYPQSIAVLGASTRPQSVGGTVMRNLLSAGFDGPIMPVNPKYESVGGVLAYADVNQLPLAPDLAVICTPPATVPGIIASLGDRGTRAAVVLTAGLEQPAGTSGVTLQQAMLDAARPHLMRILGPNCVGLLSSKCRLNASFAHTSSTPGGIAFLTQSGALSTAILDGTRSKGVGLSHFVSVGNSADVDFGDLLDFLASDPQTSSILMYIESVKHARKFMSAARAAARNKPVVAVKSGRVAEGARAAASHTGALAGADEVYDAAIRRAGILRVDTIEDLFDAVETLARAKPLRGEHLTILTNGGGPGVMATDALIRNGGQLAKLSPATVTALNGILPINWSKENPVDIIGDASAKRYCDALRVLLDDPAAGTILVLHAPTALVSSVEIAREVGAIARESTEPILTCWLGRDGVDAARKVLADDGVPGYYSPEDAVRAHLHMVMYRRNQQTLSEVPSTPTREPGTDVSLARSVVAAAAGADRQWLTEPEAKQVLTAYGIDTVTTRIAESPEQAVQQAIDIGFPVALKLLSPDITHKSDVGGVALALQSAEQVGVAAEQMWQRVSKSHPEARLEGFTVQQMVTRPGALELIVGAITDPVFGPAILFGQGGTAVEVIQDRALALPPLNAPLARDLISRTRVARLMAGYRDRPPVDGDAVCRVLNQVARLVADLPEVVELDINPLLADSRGVIALDARIRVRSSATAELPGMAIRPYPSELEATLDVAGQSLLVRPIRPEDERLLSDFCARINATDARFRFYGRDWPIAADELPRYTQIDYNREMALVAFTRPEVGEPEILGVARAISDPDGYEAELAVLVRSDIKGHGLGTALTRRLVEYCEKRGLAKLVGRTLPQNVRMVALAESMGFVTKAINGGDAIELTLQLPLPAGARAN
jgi:acetyltransferase